VKYIDGQFIMILPIGGFQFEIFPAILSNLKTGRLRMVRLKMVRSKANAPY
jgi:hypothetical protein